MAQRERLLERRIADSVHVALNEERTLLPSLLVVVGGEERDLDDDAALGRLGDEVLQAVVVHPVAGIVELDHLGVLEVF